MREMSLNLPSNYVDIESDEMEYIDGGGFFDESITGMGTLLLAVGAMMYAVGSYHAIDSMLSNGLAVFLVGASLAGSVIFYSMEKRAWNTMRLFFRKR